jgi:hypothetical protein
MLPFAELGLQVGVSEFDRWPEFLQCGLLHPLDLVVEVWGAGLDGTKFDTPLSKLVLDLVGKELLTSVCLNRSFPNSAGYPILGATTFFAKSW